MTHHVETNDYVSIMTFNMWHLTTSYESRLDSLSDEIRYWRPDILCLQEVRRIDKSSTARMLAKATGMQLVVEAHRNEVDSTEPSDGNAILSTLPVVETETFRIPSEWGASKDMAVVRAVLKSPSGRHWQVATTHLDWGPNSENSRLRQTQEIVDVLQRKEYADQVTIFAGDFNTLPEWATLSYLTGKNAGDPATLWLDAWATSGEGEGYTSDTTNPWAADAASGVKIRRPEWLPHRRIDYIMVHGYAYGRPGYPARTYLTCRPRKGRVTPSDHYGVYADLWDPMTGH